MQPYRHPGLPRQPRGVGGLSRDGALYSRAPDAFTHRVAMYGARLYATAMSSSFEIANSSTNIASRTVDSSNSSNPTTPAGLGDLDHLRAEVVMIVLEHCTLRTLLRLLRVNRTARALVRCLRGFDSVADTTKGNRARARGAYHRIWTTLVRIHPFHGLRLLLTGKMCDKSGGAGARLRVAKVKILCDKCDAPVGRLL
ncbi:hypothetical protein PG994_012706 [Apiospora phragmitis]|uniref:F-box domain-containing protein n=1 Tax=Apiospora phragmitis TaxID=2905665 RepID=A0ABR1TB86_9PEZI